MCHEELRDFITQIYPGCMFEFVSADDTYLVPCIFKRHGQMVATYPDAIYKITKGGSTSYVVYELKTRWSGALATEDMETTQLGFVRARDPSFTEYNVQAATQCLAASFVHADANYVVQVASVPPANTVSVIDISTFFVSPPSFRGFFGISLQNAVYKHLLMSDAYEYYADDVVRIKRSSHAVLAVVYGCAAESYDEAVLITLTQTATGAYDGYREWHPWAVEDHHRSPRSTGKRYKTKTFKTPLPSALQKRAHQIYKPVDGSSTEHEAWDKDTVEKVYADKGNAYKKKHGKTTYTLTLVHE
jgi:hypothetical protein